MSALYCSEASSQDSKGGGGLLSRRPVHAVECGLHQMSCASVRVHASIKAIIYSTTYSLLLSAYIHSTHQLNQVTNNLF